MKINKFVAALLSSVMLICTGCASEESSSDTKAVSESSAESTVSEPDTEAPEIPVLRPEPVIDPSVEDPESCTVLIYMCGSNLESKQGVAGKNIDEILSADIPENVNVIIETGGTRKWRSHDIARNRLRRYTVKDHELVLLEELENASMGSVETFSGFLTWGLTEYPADRNVLLLWDHGSNATQGFCYDENYNLDYLDYYEFGDSMRKAAEIRKFDITAFDACFSGSIETAFNIKDCSRYMIGSQVVVPAGGIDYDVLVSHALDPVTEDYGKLICTSYMEKCKTVNKEEGAQLALFDLAYTERIISDLDVFFRHRLLPMPDEDVSESVPDEGDIYTDIYDTRWVYRSNANLANVSRTLLSFNVVDLERFIDYLWRYDYIEDKDTLAEDFDDFIVQNSGDTTIVPYSDLPDFEVEMCQGIGLYYPLEFSRTELERYIEICPIRGYSDFLKYIYIDIPDSQIAFADKGSVNDKGEFTIELTEESKYGLKKIGFTVWKLSDDKVEVLGSNQLSVSDNNPLLGFTGIFDCEWYQLNGHWLSVEGKQNEKSFLFCADLNVNGESMRYNFSCSVNDKNEPVFDLGYLGAAIDDDGLVNRVYFPLKEGDEVDIPLLDNEPFTIGSEGVQIAMAPLPEGKYRYQFYASDLNDNIITSNYVVFEVRETDNGRTVTVSEIIDHDGD